MEQISFDGCFGCGSDNPTGLQATFRDTADGGVEGFYTPRQEHCGYRDVVHVGPIVGFMSEALGRLAFSRDMFYLTQSLTVNFKCSVSPGVRLHAMARTRKHSKKHFVGTVEVSGPDGELIATGEGSFITMVNPEIKRSV